MSGLIVLLSVLVHVSSKSPLPKSYNVAFNDPNWQNAMGDEYNMLIKNNPWTLVPRPINVNIVHCMWFFRHKYLADGTLGRYKACLIANGSTQLEGIDVDETFSLIGKSGTIRIVLSIATSRHWPVHQINVKNAFLHGDLSETFYMHQPLWFWDSAHHDYVYLLQRAHMVNYNRSQNYVDIESKLGNDGDPVSDPTLYRSLAGSLQCLTFTRLDNSYAVQLASCPTTRRSNSGYYVFLGNNLLSWSYKRQPTLSRSSAKGGGYRGVANVVVETCWLRNLLRELHTPLSFATFVYCDNVNVVYLSSNPVQHQRMKHIEIDIHFVRDLVVAGQVQVLHVPTRYQYAGIFTKGFV
nr:ribonuclease H-like domain-containing protein [Tanacetum cinerariifolium]